MRDKHRSGAVVHFPPDEPVRSFAAVTDHWEQTTAGAALAVASVVSVQFGAALATTLFADVGPLGVVALRASSAALILAAVTRPWQRTWVTKELRQACLLGAVIVMMNSCLYLAIDRLPLATGITFEMLGPLILSIVAAGSWRQRMWALPAGVGVLLLGGSLSAGDLPGVIFALTAAGGWAAYIILSHRMGSRAGLQGLAMATVAGAAISLPAGLVSAGAALFSPVVLAGGVAVGVLSAALPYSLDLLALRRLPRSLFGVLTSINPAVAALAGAVVLHDRLPFAALAGIGAVVMASVGAITTQPKALQPPVPASAQPAIRRPIRQARSIAP
jgi:inner membrane transporter RhtA